jgi:hypothetical protein
MRSLPLVIRRLRYGAPIVVVSGLPRSGTSMAMRMLQAGGMAIVADDQRVTDQGNPHGYFELEAVKDLGGEQRDTSWLAQARGKAIKIVSYQLTWLPEGYDYRVLFMERDLAEVAASQGKLLALHRDERPTSAVEETVALYRTHLEQVENLLARRRCFRTLRVPYGNVIEHPLSEAQRIGLFLDASLDAAKMAAAVDPALYRNRTSTARNS